MNSAKLSSVLCSVLNVVVLSAVVWSVGFNSNDAIKAYAEYVWSSDIVFSLHAFAGFTVAVVTGWLGSESVRL